MNKNRRNVLKLAAHSPALFALNAYAGNHLKENIGHSEKTDFGIIDWDGSLISDPRKLFDLPKDFSYKVLMSSGEMMHDGLPYGGRPDGMAAFRLNDKINALVVNHETRNLDDRLMETNAYMRQNGSPFDGGTTTIILDNDGKNVISAKRSLTGTQDNCAGGKTPWNTWISCEETDLENHGYAFEVDPSIDSGKTYKRLTGMGRFKREAVAIDANDTKGTVYQTEDDDVGLFYRFIPKSNGNLTESGQLEALRIRGFENSNNSDGEIDVGQSFDVDWVKIDDPRASNIKTREQGRMNGATSFNGGEGIICTNNANGESIVFFTCKDGGQFGFGQIWAYDPKNSMLTLFYESNSIENFWEGDNINVTPWGDLIICEDNDSFACRLLGCTPSGMMYPLGRVSGNSGSEIAGICFSNDEKIMYLNIQDEGKTIAVSGDWERIRRYRDRMDINKIHYK